MRIVVTGGAGLAGRHIVEDLLKHDFEVMVLDIVQATRTDVDWRMVDLADYPLVEDAMSGADAIIHMGAIPRPGSVTSSQLFEINTVGTFNVFEAAANLGIDRVIQGSSMSVLGYPFFYHRFAPESIPVDETHPTQPQDPYALSKLVGEEIAKAFVRRTKMVAISLRMAWIHTPESFADQVAPLQDDPAAGASHLWGYVDGRDIAQACRLAITAPVSGHLACFISAADSFMKLNTAELMAEYYPESRISPDLEGNASAFSIDLAREALSFVPEYSWETYGL